MPGCLLLIMAARLTMAVHYNLSGLLTRNHQCPISTSLALRRLLSGV